ncbi:MAG TPA: DUF2809 domain-containing protein [Acidobacteriaceae bacterium]|nr:DUF2809 domain-containing protein [Acidobacteriaceae bacterium]
MSLAHSLQRSARRRLTCLAIMLLLIPLGLICRFLPIGLPPLIVKYGGSFLWAATVYWFIAFFLARQRPFALALIALASTTAIEFLKRVQSPTLDGIRDTILGKVILGRFLSYTDIAIYWLAIFCVLWIDHSANYSRHASKE